MASTNEIIAGRVAVQVRGDNSQLKKDIGESESVLKNLKKKLGEDSGFGLAIKSLAGAGAVAGIGLAAQKFEQMTSAISDAATKLRSGQIGYSEYVGELVKSIPIFGNVVSGIENITEAITGQQARAAAAREKEAKNKATTEGSNFQSSGFDVEGANRRADELERKSGFKKMGAIERIRGEAAAPYTDRVFEINAQREAAIKAVREKNQEQIDKLTEVANQRLGSGMSGQQQHEAQLKLEEIQTKIEKEIGDIRKAAAREIAANQKAREEAIAEAEKKNADEQAKAREAAIEYAKKAIAGFLKWVPFGGGKGILGDAKDAVFRSNNFAGSAMDVSGVVTGRTDGKLDNILTAINTFATMVGNKLPIDSSPKAT